MTMLKPLVKSSIVTGLTPVTKIRPSEVFAAAMDFEEAARLRDAVVQIRAMLEGASEDETIERLRSQARKGSTFASGRKRQGARFKK